jgi:hypothetical protein
MAVKLASHQLKAVEELSNGTILTGRPGSGKSRVALAYFFVKECGGSIPINGKGNLEELRTPKDLYIITTAKKRDQLDWDKEFILFRLSKERAASFGGVKVTVDSWNNISNYAEVKDAFFVFDEQRLVGSGAWVKAFLKVAKVNRWIMLSATPGDTWLDYIPVFVANNFYKNRTEFLRRHVVYKNFVKFPKVDHYVETGRLEKLRRLVLVDMPYEKHTVRHTSYIPVEHSQELFERVFKARWNIYEDRPIKDVSELFRVMRKLVNSDVSRLAAVMQIMEKHDRLIIFYNFNYELEMLRTLGDIMSIPLGEWNGHKHEEVPEGERWFYLVQYTAGAEGWNCVETNAEIFFSLNYSYKINQQSMGRIDRLNTPYTDLYYYILRSNSMIDTSIVKSLAGKKNFNEKEFTSWLKK